MGIWRSPKRWNVERQHVDTFLAKYILNEVTESHPSVAWAGLLTESPWPGQETGPSNYCNELSLQYYDLRRCNRPFEFSPPSPPILGEISYNSPQGLS